MSVAGAFCRHSSRLARSRHVVNASTVGRLALRRSFASSASRSASASTPAEIEIVEVGPRDGLQNEKGVIPLETKIELVNRLATTGLRTIEAGSFVSPKWTPQMANSDGILKELLQHDSDGAVATGMTYQWLLPNMKGFENMLKVQEGGAAAGENQNTHEISIFMAATETFSRKNTNCTIAESLERFGPLISAARNKGLNVRAYISVALGCPYEGLDVAPSKVAEIATSLLEMGAYEISVADTTGMGTAPRTRELLKTLTAAGIQNGDLALHFHDTYGQALVNTLVGLEHGITTYDAAVAGLGGCPFSPGATGNVATEDLVHTLHSLGAHTGVDIAAVAEIGEWISREAGRPNESRAGKATRARAKAKAQAQP